MDRNIKLPRGAHVKLHRFGHIVDANCVDLLVFRCGESAWRQDLTAGSDGIPCEKCHDESFQPVYNELNGG